VARNPDLAAKGRRFSYQRGILLLSPLEKMHGQVNFFNGFLDCFPKSKKSWGER